MSRAGGGVIAYALPVHTSGTTQPLHVGIFGPVKAHLDNAIQGCSVVGLQPQPVYDVSGFHFLTFITDACSVSMTSCKIKSSFAATGPRPVNPGKLLRVPWPRSVAQASLMLQL